MPVVSLQPMRTARKVTAAEIPVLPISPIAVKLPISLPRFAFSAVLAITAKAIG